MRPPSSVPELQALSPSEFRIFAILRDGPLSVRDIGQRLASQDPDFSQTHNALNSLLQRMIKKGYVAQVDDQHNRARLFRPLLPYDLVLPQMTLHYLDSLLLTSPQ